MDNQIIALAFSEENTHSKFSDIKARHVGIRTAKYIEILKWYEEILDFRIIRKWIVGEIQRAFIAPPNDDDFIIEIISNNSNEKLNNEEVKSGYNHLCFNVENLDKTIEELNKRNISIIRNFSVQAIGKRVAFIKDPFGNSIEFCEDIG